MYLFRHKYLGKFFQVPWFGRFKIVKIFLGFNFLNFWFKIFLFMWILMYINSKIFIYLFYSKNILLNINLKTYREKVGSTKKHLFRYYCINSKLYDKNN